MAIQRNVTAADNVFCNEDKQLVFTIYAADGTTPENISGWTLSWMLKRQPATTVALLEKTTTAGIVLTTPVSGVCTVTLADTDTDSVQPGTYFHELKRTDSGLETVLTYGTFTLRQPVHG